MDGGVKFNMNSLNRMVKKLSVIVTFSLLLSLVPPSFVSALEEGGDRMRDSNSSTTVTTAVYSRLEMTPNPVVLVPGASQVFNLRAYDEDGLEIPIPNEHVHWQADPEIGTMTENRLQTAASVPSGFKYGYVRAVYQGTTAEALVLVGQVSAVLEEFDSLSHQGKATLSAATINANSAAIELAERPEPVLYGEYAGKFSYDMTGTTGTSAAYVSLRNLDTGALDRPIEGNPVRVGLWVYGDNNNHWLRARLRNGAGAFFAIDFTTTSSFTWQGWRYVTADIPANQTGPFKFMDVYIAETKNDNKDAGVVYYDRLSVFYTDTNVFGVDLTGLTPMRVGESKTAQVKVTRKHSTAPEAVNSGVTFLSSHPEIASINAAGLATAAQAGKTTIIALYADAQPALFELTVTEEAPSIDYIKVSGPASIEAGRQGTAIVFAKFSDHQDKLDVSDEAIWTSSDEDVARISAGGRIHAVSPGSTVITVRYSGLEASHTLTVTEPIPVLHSIKLSGLSSMTIGSELTAKVLAEYYVLDRPYETVELTEGVAYASSNPEVATIDSDGMVTARSVGVSVITASYLGQVDSYALVVNKETEAPKRELRAAWIATVENIDWPKQGVFDAEQQKRDLAEMLDSLEAAGFNAIVMQIKPTADAFYPSQYAPWSHWLTGEQGKDPGYDPLAFAIEEARKRNMEFHAWFNPYRVSMDTDLGKLVPDHPARLNPDWVVSYGGRLLFNPGNPETTQYIIDTIMEVVEHYDIDAVHFDDYFYPYPVAGVDFPDEALYQQYGAGFATKADWRRHNVNTLIQQLSERIKQEKPYVQFGISPFGIWRNQSTDPEGSDTNGLQSYDAIYADTRKWVQEEWIDYIAPQIYWYFNYGPAAYEKLIDWWAEQTRERNVQLYIGHAAYRVGSDDRQWQDPEQLPNQIVYNRNFEEVDGSIFFAANHVLSNPLGLKDRLQTSLFQYPALVPHLNWLSSKLPEAPESLSAYSVHAGVELRWADDAEDTAYYVIYRAEGEQAPDLEEPRNILHIARKVEGSDWQYYTDRTAIPATTYSYAVTAVDRAHGEGLASHVSLSYEAGIGSMQALLDDYISSGQVSGPLVKQLTNRLEQVKHHASRGAYKQAVKHMEDFLKHLNNKPMQQHISEEAKRVLSREAQALIEHWSL